MRMIESRPLQITAVSANDPKNVNLFSKKNVYAVASIEGDPYITQKQKTPVHKGSGPNPTWNFSLDEAALQQNLLTLKFQIKSHRSVLSDKEIGEVRVSIKKLLDGEAAGDGEEPKYESYTVWTATGEVKGTLNFTYKFGDKYNAPPLVEAMAYPPAGYPGFSSAPHPPAPGGYEAPPPPGAYTYPPPGAYPPQPQYAYGGDTAPPRPPGAYPYPPPGAYPPPPQYAYGGYPAPPPPGYGYPGYLPQQPPKENGGWNVVLGAGNQILGVASTLGKISDVGAMLANDAYTTPDWGMF